MKLIVFLQGGLGNQLLQASYAYYLSQTYKLPFKLATPLLSPFFYSFFPRLTPRQPSHVLRKYCASNLISISSIILLLLVRLRINPFPVISDTILVPPAKKDIWPLCCMLGYFQNSNCFSPPTEPYWIGILDQLPSFPTYNIGVHIRLGDYTNPTNSSIFYQVDPIALLNQALQRQRLTQHPDPILVFSDQPNSVQNLLEKHFPSHSNYFLIVREKSDLNCFSLLSHCRTIIGSNSTFSLCASWLSFLRYSRTSPSFIPPIHWYSDPFLDKTTLSFITSLPFVFRR